MKFHYWLGALCLAVAPFHIDFTYGKILAIIGLSLLTQQALELKAYNLVALNTIGILGYLYSISL